MLESIQWPKKFLPGDTDHFVSNESIVKGAPVPIVWTTLNNTSLWPKFYNDIKEVAFDEKGKGPELYPNCNFNINFNLGGNIVQIHCEVIEFMNPETHLVGRLAWHGLVPGDTAHKLEFVQAWLVEPLVGDRTRLLSGLSMIGQPAIEDAKLNPDPLLIGRQDWINGILAWARKHA